MAGTVYSVAKLRGKENIFEEGLFQIIFVLYSYELMALQISMIVAIGGAYYNEYNETYMEGRTMNISNVSSEYYTTPSTIDVNYSPSGTIWYLIVCGYVTPILGVIMFFVVSPYWTQQFPIEVILDILKSLKSSVKKAVLLKKVGEEYVETLEKLSTYLNERKFADDYKNIKSLHFCWKLGYPFKRPVHIILLFLYIAMFTGFIDCCAINDFNRAWFVYYYIFVLLFGLTVTYYVFLANLIGLCLCRYISCYCRGLG